MLRCRAPGRSRTAGRPYPTLGSRLLPWPPPLSARWTALALFLLALGLHLFVAIGGTFGGMDFRTLIIADELGAILLAPVLMALLLRLRPGDAFLFRSAHWGHYVVAGAAAIPLQAFGGSLQEVIIESLPGSDDWRALLEQAMEPLARTQGFGDLALLLLGGVVLAAVCEEILFRGLMFQLLAIGGRWMSAVLVTAFLFALFHLDPIGLLPRTLMGIYFAALVFRSGSIFPAMLAHGANNLLAFAALPFADPDAAPPTLVQAGLIAVGSGLVLAVIVAIWWRTTPAPALPARLSRALGGDSAAPGPPPLSAEGPPAPTPRHVGPADPGFSDAADEPTDSSSRPDSTPRTDRHGS